MEFDVKVGVVGLGYIGLPTAGLLAGRGYNVLGMDINVEVVKTINTGNTHLHEPGLADVILKAVKSGKLVATTEPQACDVFIIAVPTPFKENFSPDIDFVESATRFIAPAIKAGDMVILESTVPVGTTQRVAEIIREMRKDLFPEGGEARVDFAHCPERVLPGKILHELVHNDRVVGGIGTKATERACTFYRSFVKGEVVATDDRTAELCKLTENAFRDVNIAFANEISMICDSLKIDVWELIALANRHPRVKILQPGPGVGGHCIPVDPWFIVSSAPELSDLIRASRKVNMHKTHFVVDKIKSEVRAAGGKTVVCLGCAFKPNVDDFRESPAIDVISELAADKNLKIFVVEPYAKKLPESLAHFGNIHLTPFEEALAQSSVLALLVDHDEFKFPDPALLSKKRVVDTRGVWRNIHPVRIPRSA